MFKASVVVDDQYLIDAYVQLLRDAPEVVNRLVNEAVNANRDALLARLRTEPGAVVYPIRWTSERQRRAYFATNGFGAGIPYRRTHKLVGSWRVLVVYQPGQLTSVEIGTDDPKEQFVTGRHQQRFHAVTGWYKTENVLDAVDKRMTDDVETALIRSFYAVEDL